MPAFALTSVLDRYKASYAGLPSRSWQGLWLTLFSSISIGVCFFISLYFVNTLHFTVAQAGLLMSVYGFGTVFGGILSATIVDHCSPRLLAAFSALVRSMAFLLLSQHTEFPSVFGDLLVLGISSYSFKAAIQIWILEQCKASSSQRLKTISISYVASNLGLGISGLMLGMFMSKGFKPIFYSASVLQFLSSVYLFTLNPKTNIQPIDEGTDFKQPVIQFSRLIFMLACVFAIGLVISQLGSTYPIYVKQAFPELGDRAVSILFLLDAFLIVLFQAPLTNAVNRYNHILVAGVGGFLMGLGMLILCYSSFFIVGMLSCVIWTTGEMLFISMAQSVSYECGAVKKKGRAMGVFQAAFAASTVLGPFLGGLVFDRLGGDWLWYLSFFIGLAVLLACSIVAKRSR